MATAAARLKPDVPAFVEAWVRQLLEPAFVDLLRDAGERQIEVRLYTNAGRVRRRPAVMLDAGTQEMIDPQNL